MSLVAAKGRVMGHCGEWQRQMLFATSFSTGTKDTAKGESESIIEDYVAKILIILILLN